MAKEPSNDILIYYFYGEDNFRIEREIEKIISQTLKEGSPDFNFDNLANPSVEDFLSIANSFPVFADKRILRVENFEASLLSNKEVMDYLLSPLASTIVIFNDKSIKINENSKPIKELKTKKYFKLSRLRGLYDNELPSYIKNAAAGKEIKLSLEACSFLSRYTGNNTSNIDNELNKIVMGLSKEALRREITLKELKPILSFSKKYSVFDFTDKFIERDLKAAFGIFGVLYENGEEPVKLISILYNELRKILRAKIQESGGLDPATIININSIPPFLKNKFLKNMSNLTVRDLQKLLELLEETDFRLKTSSFAGDLILEDFIFKSGLRK